MLVELELDTCWDRDHIHACQRMLCSALEESREDDPDDSIVVQMRLNISPPEEYSGSSYLKVYETFVAGILQWLKLHSLLGVKYTKTQVQFWVCDSKAMPVSGLQGT